MEDIAFVMPGICATQIRVGEGAFEMANIVQIVDGCFRTGRLGFWTATIVATSGMARGKIDSDDDEDDEDLGCGTAERHKK
ncbi:unnamed protein product [Linum trigynum]|uniref:Uncharacterized protein n=1 Tax=Linum trigynum TaxID=586398 RepID=A0AAV2CZM5_9ROSI